MKKQSGARTTLRSIAFAVPAVLLALGWFQAMGREDQAHERTQQAIVASAANAVLAAVTEGLEELRTREDEHPYYHYNYYFTPPDLIATQESIAVSPLGRMPRDPRVRGHFQVDPGNEVHSPENHSEAPPSVRRRGEEVLTALRSELSGRLLSLTRSAPRGNNLAQFNLVQNQGQYSAEVLRDIRQAQAGNTEASTRNAFRGRAPMRQRVVVSWSNPWGYDNNATNYRGAEEGDGTADPIRGADSPNGSGAHQPLPNETDAALYTPMRYAREGNSRYLFRVVTTEGAASVQGVLLDTNALKNRWLPAVAARHAITGLQVRFETSSRACPSARTLPVPLDDVFVCASFTNPPVGASVWRWLSLMGVVGLALASAIARARALRRAEDLATTERAFVASVSHELRTPLTTLRMHAEMLHEGWVSEERKPRVLKQLVDESERLARLIEDVLTFGRLADGRANLQPVPTQLAGLVRKVCEREETRLLERGIRLEYPQETEGEEEQPKSFIDPAAMEQILLNLLENAAKYAGAPRDAEPRPVRVSVETKAPFALLRVADEGPGIPAADRERVFERFYRTHNAERSHVAGTGLGLAIVRGLSRAMGGDARVLDTSKGASIEVTVPLVAAPSETATNAPSLSDGSSAH